MAKGDVRIIANGGLQAPPAANYRTEAAATAILAGEPVKIGGTSNAYVIPSADAEPVTSAPTFVGIADSDSVHTSTADGDIKVLLASPLLIFEAKAKSSAAVDTQAEINAILNDLVAFDLTSSSYTVDTASAASTNGLIIVGGNPILGTVFFRVRLGATVFA